MVVLKFETYYRSPMYQHLSIKLFDSISSNGIEELEPWLVMCTLALITCTLVIWYIMRLNPWNLG